MANPDQRGIAQGRWTLGNGAVLELKGRRRGLCELARTFKRFSGKGRCWASHARRYHIGRAGDCLVIQYRFPATPAVEQAQDRHASF